MHGNIEGMDSSSNNASTRRVPSPTSKRIPARNERKYRIRKSSKKSELGHIGEASDGEIYILIRESMATKDEQRTDNYRNRLSRCKQISLHGLLRRVKIVKHLDNLRIFPGILDGLELGNVHKHLSLHCDRNIIHFLESHVKNTWLDITGNDPGIQQHVDPVTVRRLQFRVPAASSSDRRQISQMFDSGDVFKGILDVKVRDQVKENVLAVKVVIPSVESFHENMKFLSLGMKIIRKTITDPSPQGTWLEAFLKCWRPPVVPYVETAHGDLKPLAAPQLTAHLAFTQLTLAALRNFPYLCSEHPRQDKRGESMPAYTLPSMVLYLSELASRLGFNSKTIEKNMTQDINEHSSIAFRPERGLLADWRGGKPFTKTFFALRSQAFLPRLSQPMTPENEPSPLFILKDFMKAFFGSFEAVVLDKNKSPITLAAAAASAMAVTAQENGARPGKSRSRKRRVEGMTKRRSSYRVEKPKRGHSSTGTRTKLRNALVRSSDILPTHSRPWSESLAGFSTDEQGLGTGETIARSFYRSPIPSPIQSPLGVPGHTAESRSRVTEIQNSDSDSEASVIGTLNHSTFDTMPGDDTPHQDSLCPPIPSFSTYDSRFSGQTASAAPSTPSAPTLASLRSPSSGEAAIRSGKSEGGYTMPNRNVRSYLGKWSNESCDNGQPAIRIPPIRSMRSARKPRLGHIPSRSSLSQGSTVEQNGFDGRSLQATGGLGFNFGPATERTRVTELTMPATPLRPEVSGLRRSGPFFGQGVQTPQEAKRVESSHFTPEEDHGFPASATRRHAVYIPVTAERRGWFGSDKMPFGRPGRNVRFFQRGEK